MSEYIYNSPRAEFTEEECRIIIEAGIRYGTPLIANTYFLYDHIEKLVLSCNAKFWEYNLYVFGGEDIQFAENDGICLSSDSVEEERRLTVIVQLSDEFDYVGGEVKCGGKVMHKNRGSVAIFPSYMKYSVGRVLQGNRYSLVAYAHGN